MKERRATSLDIAYRAGVSQSTVSRALRNSPLVTPETRQKIQEIARELNYRVDKNAAGLRSQSSKTLALLLFEDPTTDDSHINPFFLSLLGSITRFSSGHGYDLLLSFQQFSEDWHIDYEVSSRADGIILLGYGDYMTYREKLEQLDNAGARFIIWGPKEEGQPGLSLSCDNFAGGRAGAEHLIQLGHRQIAFIGGNTQRSPEFMLRYQGHMEALREAGIEPEPGLQHEAYNFEEEGCEGVHKLLRSGKKFTAIQCASDLIAIGAIRALREHQLEVPRDISVLGFDDIPAASYMYPPLTTVHQDTHRSGELLVAKLIQLIEGETVQSELVTPRLVERQSCAPLAK
ncbi:MAG: LacI family transcriptional regulator [Gammaproteobacteria bacterium]|uniref:LacI family DNA-binding transcriptional regulator n=1 Tax=Pseudomaricurvus alcaniphilus TaxID=1166482 RepID=UPI00140C601B|nr:LacI family DNA-binding transcriptional regulator [Pseudomaricurvus alcaniphilus]MBR9912252.1 LacI family transcriptional regulator [Gammaproteobacteria bacterium]NHN37371.1 LacI family transcriptional regulator [Pseudomaricurvus alcaniphilus]